MKKCKFFRFLDSPKLLSGAIQSTQHDDSVPLHQFLPMASVLLKGGFLRRIAKETMGRKEKGRPTWGELNSPDTT